MRRVSTKAEYACLAMLALATQGPAEPPLRLRAIAEAYGIPERYLVQILLQLKSSGLVTSVRGASGGYRLARPAERISLGEVLTAIDGPEELPHESSGPGARVLAGVWAEVREAERKVLSGTTLDRLAGADKPPDWVI